MVKDVRIETERLLIRAYKEEDLLECFQLMQNMDLFKYLNMDIMSLEEYKELFYWLIRCYNVGFDGDFKYSCNIILKETGKHIGWCGIGGSEFDHAQKEIYYLIGREYWGKGYAKEAATALLDYGFNIIGLDKIFALVNPENIASKCVIENMGLIFQYIIEGLPEKFDHYNKHLCYLLTKDEFKAMKNVFEIECEDIILRDLRLQDLDVLYKLTLQPEITDYLPDWIASREQRRRWLVNFRLINNREFLANVPNISNQGLMLGIILKKTNEFIGWCATWPKHELPAPNREIAYAISKYHRGKGYTTQAAQGLIKYLFDKTNVDELNAIALTHNIASNKVIQKCGFEAVGVINIENEDFNYYKLKRS